MPELPEVESSRRLLESHCKGKRISSVVALEAGGGARDGAFDDIVLGEGISEEGLSAALIRRAVVAVRRRGKQLWLELDGSGPHLLMHFGMTGAIVIEGVGATTYKSFKVSGSFPPRFSKLQLGFDGGLRLALADPRRLARVLLREDLWDRRRFLRSPPTPFVNPPASTPSHQLSAPSAPPSRPFCSIRPAW